MKFKLSEISKISNGKKAVFYDDGTVPVYGANGPIGTTQNSKYNVGDIVIGRVGANAGAVHRPISNFWASDNTMVVTPGERVRSEYLTWLLQKTNFNQMTSGSAQPLLNQDILNSIDFEIPGLSEQDYVISVIEPFENQMGVLTSINDNLLELAETMFSETFPQFRSDGNTIGDYIKPKRGKNLLSKNIIEGEVPVVAGGLKPAGFHNEANTVAPVITISASGANAGFTNIWEENVWSSDSSYIDITVTQNVYFWFLMLKKRQQEIFGAQTGSAQPHIYPKHIEEMPTGNIRDNEISEFNKRIGPMFEVMGASSAEIKTLVNIRDTLIRKMLY